MLSRLASARPAAVSIPANLVRREGMRRIIVNTFLSLDGVMQAPGGPGEDPTGNFELEGWSVNYWDDLMGQQMDKTMGHPFDLLIGRKTYEIFAAYWPTASEEEGAGPLNRATKYVVTTRLERADWGPSELIKGDVVPRIRRLKAEEGPELQVHGSSNLLQTLIKHELVDQYNIMIFPVVLGRGKRLFGDGTVPAGLRLVESVTSSTGVIVARYEAAGAVTTGTFAPQQPAES
jgi:dihydrofolate reductase